MDTQEYAQATFIMLYWSCHNEVHTHDLVRIALEEGRRVCLPRCEVEHRQITAHQVTDLCGDLEIGPYGILQPRAQTIEIADLHEIEVCAVPGIAFDREGNRVGRGFGYYDRFLRKLSPETSRIGVAHAFQIVSKICPTDGDIRMHKVVTENETLVARCSVIK